MENSFKLRTGYIFIHLPIANHLLVPNTYEHVLFRYLWLMSIRFFHVSQTHIYYRQQLCQDRNATMDTGLLTSYFRVIIYRLKVMDGMYDMENAFSAQKRKEADIFGSNFEPHLGRPEGPGLRVCQHIMSWRSFPCQWPTIYAELLKEAFIFITGFNIGYCLFSNRISMWQKRVKNSFIKIGLTIALSWIFECRYMMNPKAKDSISAARMIQDEYRKYLSI